MKQARWFGAGLVWAIYLACSRPATQKISVEHTERHFGDVLARCEIEGATFHLRVSATCVVDSNQRIVVSNFASGRTLLDTNVTGQALPNFPVDGGVGIDIPCADCPKLEEEKHHLIVELMGDCGSEHAAGSEQCGTSRK